MISLEELFYQAQTNPLVIRALLLILILVIVYHGIKKIPGLGEDKKIKMAISLIISILATYYLTDQLIEKFILIPYKTLGLTIMICFPFLILTLITHKTEMQSLTRRGVWIAFAVILAITWFKIYKTLETLSNQILIIFTIATIIMILADKPIHKILKKILN